MFVVHEIGDEEGIRRASNVLGDEVLALNDGDLDSRVGEIHRLIHCCHRGIKQRNSEHGRCVGAVQSPERVNSEFSYL